MMLDQIEKRLEKKMAAKAKGWAKGQLLAAWPEEGKTLGLKIPSHVREALVRLQKNENLPSLKAAVQLAVLRGLGMAPSGMR